VTLFDLNKSKNHLTRIHYDMILYFLAINTPLLRIYIRQKLLLNRKNSIVSGQLL